MGFPVGDTRRSNHSLNELGHLGDGVFDRDRWISAVEVVEVDVINFQLRQRLVEGLVDVFWICSYVLETNIALVRTNNPQREKDGHGNSVQLLQVYKETHTIGIRIW